MRLGVNGWRLQTRTGVARVLLNILKHWNKDFVAGRFDVITVYTPKPLDPDLDIPGFVEQRIVGPNWRMLLWDNLRFAPAAKDDVLLCPSYSRPLFTTSKTVVMLYDATPKLHPEFYPLSARFIYAPLYGWSARHATLVITSTEQSKSDIVDGYGALPDRVRLLPLAPAEIFRPTQNDLRLADVRRKYVGSMAPFFLYVGKLTTRRNVPRLVEALAEMKRRRPLPHKLVIVGMNTTNVDIAALGGTTGVADDVKYHAYVEDEDLALLFSAAEAFVLPYSYESGASLTLLEAQAAGTPVITTDCPGLRAAAGEGALLTPDVEVLTLANAMLTLAGDPALRRDLSAKGSANAARYSWQRSSHEILNLLSEAAHL